MSEVHEHFVVLVAANMDRIVDTFHQFIRNSQVTPLSISVAFVGSEFVLGLGYLPESTETNYDVQVAPLTYAVGQDQTGSISGLSEEIDKVVEDGDVTCHSLFVFGDKLYIALLCA